VAAGALDQVGFAGACDADEDHAGVSAPAKPANVDGAVFFDSLGRNAELSERPEPTPGAESVPGCSESREAGHPKGGGSRAGASPPSQQTRCAAANPQLIDGKTLIQNYTFGIETQDSWVVQI